MRENYYLGFMAGVAILSAAFTAALCDTLRQKPAQAPASMKTCGCGANCPPCCDCGCDGVK